jgi:ribosomal protein S18 acetylase RimI-like enzyme
MKALQTITVREFLPFQSEHDKQQLHEAFLCIWNAPQNHRFLSFGPESFTSTQVSEWFDEEKARYAHVYCALNTDGSIVGIAVSIFKDAHSIEIYGIGVTPESQGCGIGRKLIEHIITEARTKQMETVSLIVYEDNDVMLGLIDSLGFQALAQGPDKRYDGTPTIRFILQLEKDQTDHEPS